MKYKFKLVVFNKLSMLDRWVKGFNILDDNVNSYKVFYFMELKQMLQRAKAFNYDNYKFEMIDLEDHSLMNYDCEVHNRYLQEFEHYEDESNWIAGRYVPNYEI